MKTKKDKANLIKQIRKTPIVQIACEKTGICRATYYRWRGSNNQFREQADQALEEGASIVNDMAESQLISGIRAQNMTAIIFWLKHHHRNYKTKIEVSGEIKTVDEVLTTEQKKIIEKAIKLASAGDNNNNLTRLK